MSLFHKFVVALALGAASALPVAAAESGSAQVADYKLANGLELVVIPDHRAPVDLH